MWLALRRSEPLRARRLGTPLPTIYRVLGTLVEEGYLVRLNSVRGYGLGYRVVGLYRGLTDQIVPPAPVREQLAGLHSGIGAAVYLALLRDTDVVLAHADSCTAHPGAAGMRVGAPRASIRSDTWRATRITPITVTSSPGTWRPSHAMPSVS